MEASLASLAGVKRSVIELGPGKVHVWFRTGVAEPTSEELIKAVAKSGFTATEVEFAREEQNVEAESGGGAEAIENPLDFKLKTLTGNEYDSALLKGHVVLLDFWATWCAPCIAAFPTLNRLENDLGGKGLRVVGIALNSGTSEDIAEVIGERAIEYPILLGDAGIEKKFDVLGYPTYFLIDRDGEVLAVYVGEVADLYERVSEELSKLDKKRRSD